MENVEKWFFFIKVIWDHVGNVCGVCHKIGITKQYSRLSLIIRILSLGCNGLALEYSGIVE